MNRLGHALARSEDLGDEERVATGETQEIGWLSSRVGCQSRDRGEAEWWNRQAVCGFQWSQLAEHLAQWVIAIDLVVAVGADERASRVLDAPTHEAEEIQGRLVGPVDVLDHHHDGSDRGTEAVEHVSEDVDGLAARDVEISEPRVGVGGEVEKGTQWPWRRQRVAGTLDGQGRPVEGGDERVDECCLPRSRFTGDQHQRSGSVRGLPEQPSEAVEQILPL